VTRDRLSRSFWLGAVAILVAAALVAIGALLRWELGETDGKILLTLLALLVSGGAAVAGLSLVERGLLGGAGWVVVAAAAGGFVVVTAATWEGFDDDTLARLAGTAAVVVPAMLIVTTQLLLLRDRRLTFLVVGSAVTLGLAAAILTVGIWTDDLGDEGGKAIAVLTILGALGWVLVPVLQRLAGAQVAPAEHAEHLLATFDGLEAVANADPAGALLVIEPARGELIVRNPAGASHLRPGERIVLRSRSSG
jgi:hypothetical protein